jgi:hypothetical protein
LLGQSVLLLEEISMTAVTLHHVPSTARNAGLVLIVLAVIGLIDGLVDPGNGVQAFRSTVWLAVLGASAFYLWRGDHADLVNRKGLRGYLRVASALWFVGGTLGTLMSLVQLGAEANNGPALALGLIVITLGAASLIYGGYHLSKLCRSAKQVAAANVQTG